MTASHLTWLRCDVPRITAIITIENTKIAAIASSFTSYAIISGDVNDLSANQVTQEQTANQIAAKMIGTLGEHFFIPLPPFVRGINRVSSGFRVSIFHAKVQAPDRPMPVL